uniref:Tail fiber protein n=1 Tax=Micrococcus phage Kurnik TaxID=3092208 RepID=A0AAU6R6J7_9CAUD
MTQTSWPFDNADTTEAQYSEIFKRLVTTGVWADPASTLLLPFADSSGMQVKLRTGYAFVRGFLYYNDAILTLPIAAAETQPRVDAVVLRLDPAANTIVAAIVKGTAAANPVAPNLEQTTTGKYELLLGTVSIPASTSTVAAGQVTDQRSFSSAPFGHWTSAKRPTDARRGDSGFNYTINAIEFWDGSDWIPVLAGTTITASMISDQQNINAGRLNGRRFTVSNTGAPSAPAVGDVWIDWS